MMQDLRSAAFARSEDACMLELEYRKGCVLHILLPDSPSGLERLEARLTPELLDAWIGTLDRRMVDLWLPRFRGESGYDLADSLAEMGMHDAFDSTRADFSGIGSSTTGIGLFLSAVVQKSFIDVNEVETQAGAASAIGAELLGLGRGFEQFHVDRPFLYMVRNRRNGSILFIGRMTGCDLGGTSGGDRA